MKKLERNAQVFSKIDNKKNQNADVVATDVAIVGGGLVGLSLALLLSRSSEILEELAGVVRHSRPWKITVLERFSEAKKESSNTASSGIEFHSSFDARSTALSKSSENIFELAGIWPQLSSHLTPINTVHVSDKGHFGGAQLRASEHNISALGYVAENAWLGKILATSVAARSNVNVQAPAVVTKIVPNTGGYHLTLSGQDQPAIQASLVIIADGAESNLRSQLGIEADVHDYEQVALVANVESDQPHGGIAYERFTDEGPIALLPLGESPTSAVSALIWTQPSNAGVEMGKVSDGAFLSRLQGRFGYRQGRFLRVSRRHSYPLQLQLAREQIRRSLVVMGNAAHFLHPVAGQGFNLALRDCLALTLSLATGESEGKTLGDPAVLQDYYDNQSPDQWATVKLSDSLVRLYTSTQFGASVLRNLGILALGATPPANRLFARQAMGFSLG